MREAAAQLPFANLLPRAFGVLLGATHACCKVLQTVHVQSATTIAWWQNAFTLGERFHLVHHLCLERSSVVLLQRLTAALASCRKKARRCVGYRNRRVHHGMQL